MKTFTIITNNMKDPGLEFTHKVCDVIEKEGCTAISGENAAPIPDDTDCVIVLGGDGSVLQAAARIDGRRIPILGINLGTMGYLAEIEKKDFEAAFAQLLAGDYSLEERMMLDGEVIFQQNTPGMKHKKTRPVHSALNDVVFARSGPLRILNYDIYVNGQFLNSFNADGIILATPTGSTAYNLSAGGPIVEPSARMILMTPICPHTLNNRSIVLSSEDVVEVHIGRTSTDRCLEADADFDGNVRVKLRTGDSIRIRRSEKTVQLVRLSKRSFLETLHRKMTTI